MTYTGDLSVIYRRYYRLDLTFYMDALIITVLSKCCPFSPPPSEHSIFCGTVYVYFFTPSSFSLFQLLQQPKRQHLFETFYEFVPPHNHHNPFSQLFNLKVLNHLGLPWIADFFHLWKQAFKNQAPEVQLIEVKSISFSLYNGV